MFDCRKLGTTVDLRSFLTSDNDRSPGFLAKAENLLLHFPRERLPELPDAPLQRLRRKLFGVEQRPCVQAWFEMPNNQFISAGAPSENSTSAALLRNDRVHTWVGWGYHLNQGTNV